MRRTTKKVRSIQDSASRAIARRRGYFFAFFAIAGVNILGKGLYTGRLSDRFSGTIAYNENPMGFLAAGMGWAFGICVFALFAMIFFDQSRR